VRNNGQEDLTNIRLTDALAPSCSGPITLPNIIPSGFSNFSVSGSGNNRDNILQPGESFSYTCSSPNTQTGYTNSIRVDANGRFSND
jgi:hypothetical protein